MLTLFAGGMRFAWLDRPTLWNDEAATFMRAYGSQERLLMILRGDGFGPLHYELTWLIGLFTPLTPFWMRFVPALCGTLFVPAIYWLARELFNLRIARLAAVFACCSAFAMVYSRDAKMYMQTWFAITLYAAALFAFIRRPHWFTGLVGLFAGSAAMWLHATGFAVLPLTFLALLLDRRVRMTALAGILVGAALMAVGPIWYAIDFNHIFDEVAAEPSMGLRGIGWVNTRIAGHSNLALLMEPASCFLYGFYWIDQEFVHSSREKWAMLGDGALLSAIACVGVAAIVLPRRRIAPTPSIARAATPDATSAPPAKPIAFKATPLRLSSILFIAIWGLVPIYGIFRKSGFHDITATNALESLWTRDGKIALGIAAAFFVLTLVVHRWRRALTGLLVLAWVGVVYSVAVTLLQAVVGDSDYHFPPPSILSPLSVPRALPLAAVGVLLARAWQRGPRFRDRVGGAWRPVLVTLVLVALLLAVDHFLGDRKPGAMWMPRYMGFVFPALVIGAAALALRIPGRAFRWTAISLFIGVNLAQATARVVCDTDPPVDKVAADLLSDDAKAGRTFVYAADPIHTGGPTATGSIVNQVGRYYVVLKSGVPRERADEWMSLFRYRPTWNAKQILWDVRDQPQVQRIIVWDPLPTGPTREALIRSRTLPSPWKLLREDRYTVRSFWYWGTLYDYRRSEYVRETAATMPAATPATTQPAPPAPSADPPT